MKLFRFFIILLLLNSCSFDNKSGIWKNENNISDEENQIFKEFKSISYAKKKFNKIINLDKNFKFNKSKTILNLSWQDIFYSNDNNFVNFNYDNQNKLIFKSKRLTKNITSKHILFDENNLISSDKKGNIIIFSINENKELVKFNFYKKKFKKIQKKLNYIIENNIIYISDNLGFVYSFDYKKNKILWAKNYKIPFRSNIKISNNKIILANQNNTLHFLDKKNGEILKTVPTEESPFKKYFRNNLAFYKDKVVFLNTYGSLYVLNIKSMKIDWFINLNQSLDINPSNIFTSNQLIIYENKIFVPTNDNFYIVDILTGSIVIKKNFTSLFKPIILNNILYTIDNSLLIATELKTGETIFSYNINQKISNYLDVQRKKVNFRGFMPVENKIFIFLKNSFVLKFNANGNLDQISKLPEKINSNLIIIDGSIIYLNRKNKVAIVN